MTCTTKNDDVHNSTKHAQCMMMSYTTDDDNINDE